MLNVRVIIDGKPSKKVKIESGTTTEKLLVELKLNLETGLVKVNGKLAHPRDKLADGDEVEFINIIYGG